MANKTRIDVSGEVTLSYDENSEEFKKTFSCYKESIDPHADVSDMLKHVAFYINSFGVEGMVEGVGYVKLDIDEAVREPFSGITVDEGFDCFDFSII